MSNIPCEMIRDFLVLYDDSVCSEETKKEIEEHLAECESCRAYYREGCRTAEFELKPEIDEGERALGKIKKSIHFRQWMILVSAVLVCIGLYLFAGRFVFWTPSDEIRVEELYQLENGAIAVRLQSEKFAFQPELTMDGEGNMTYKVGTTIAANFNKVTRTYQGIENRVIVINQEQIQGGFEENAAGLKRVVYKGGMFDEELVIWEQGQEIESAPEELERRFEKAEKRWRDETERWSWLTIEDMDEELE